MLQDQPDEGSGATHVYDIKSGDDFFPQEVCTFSESEYEDGSSNYSTPDVHIAKDGTMWNIVTASNCSRF